jgi:hypothetical protein
LNENKIDKRIALTWANQSLLIVIVYIAFKMLKFVRLIMFMSNMCVEEQQKWHGEASR